MADNVYLGATSNDKKIYAVPMNNRSLLKIHLLGGGKIPEQLQGAFSSIANAQEVVDRYLETHKARYKQSPKWKEQVAEEKKANKAIRKAKKKEEEDQADAD